MTLEHAKRIQANVEAASTVEERRLRQDAGAYAILRAIAYSGAPDPHLLAAVGVQILEVNSKGADA